MKINDNLVCENFFARTSRKGVSCENCSNFGNGEYCLYAYNAMCKDCLDCIDYNHNICGGVSDLKKCPKKQHAIPT